MAIAKGIVSGEAQEFKRYIGVAPVFIESINPSKDEHEKLFNTTLEEDPKYISKITDAEGNEIDSARICVVLRPDTKTIGIEMPLITMSIFIQNRYNFNRDKTKVQIIDKYGKCTWATIEDAKAKKIPLDKNGNPLNIDKDYRPAYVGEEDLTAFIKAYLCIPEVSTWDSINRVWQPNTKVNPTECECRFDNLNELFKGNFTEIKDALGFQPTNKVKVLLGIRTDLQSGKQYQTVYTRKFLRNSNNSMKALEAEVQQMILNASVSGRTLNTQYEVVPVHEYVVEPTQFTKQIVEDIPTDDSSEDSDSPWFA